LVEPSHFERVAGRLAAGKAPHGVGDAVNVQWIEQQRGISRDLR
jgi:hypothetical protein